MKVVILAGGSGTRITEESAVRPKPMIEIGHRPILWHIMKIYTAHGLTDFIICCGYKGHIIKEYFANYFLRSADVTFDIKNNQLEVHQHCAEPWRVTLVNTGDDSMTGGRIKRIQSYIGGESFCLTYGDGVSDVNVRDLIAFHREKKTFATLTAVQLPGRFGVFALEKEQTTITSFAEKPSGDAAWINGGFFVLEPQIFDYIDGDETVWELEPMERLAREKQLSAFRHPGFWRPMDTLRDKIVLDEMWARNEAPWRVWDTPRTP
jgi:glucose-1-phosphate cytidylyltransferase